MDWFLVELLVISFTPVIVAGAAFEIAMRNYRKLSKGRYNGERVAIRGGCVGKWKK